MNLSHLGLIEELKGEELRLKLEQFRNTCQFIHVCELVIAELGYNSSVLYFADRDFGGAK